jgi:hypothetical protein
MKKILLSLGLTLFVSSSLLAVSSTSSITGATSTKSSTSPTTASKTNTSTDAFTKKKEAMLKTFDDKIEALTAAKTCIAGATDKTSFAKCKTQIKTAKNVIKKSLKTTL